jgi:hypothetical protein
VSARPFEILNRMTDCHTISYERYGKATRTPCRISCSFNVDAVGTVEDTAMLYGGGSTSISERDATSR